MALERVFSPPRRLRRLRNGPFEKLLDGFCKWLFKQGFSRRIISRHLFNISHLIEPLGHEKRNVRLAVRSEDITRLLKAYNLHRIRPAPENHLRRVSYSVNRFLAYLRGSGPFESPGATDDL